MRREMLRKPYVIGQHMYSNGVRVSASTGMKREQAIWTSSPWVSNAPDADPNAGDAAKPCSAANACPATPRDAYRSMKRLLARPQPRSHRQPPDILHDYSTNSTYRAFMPPLVGTTNEIKALGDYLASLNPTSSALRPKHWPAPAASVAENR